MIKKIILTDYMPYFKENIMKEPRPTLILLDNTGEEELLKIYI